MTKNEIIAEITAFYTFVGSPFRSKRNDNNIPTTIILCLSMRQATQKKA